MEQKLYEKIGRQEIIIEALKAQLSEVSGLVAGFIKGEEKVENWDVTPQGQLVRKEPTASPAKPARKPKKK